MATRTWYLNEVNFGGATNRSMWTRDVSDLTSGANYSDTGWNVGRTNTDNYALLVNGDEVSRNDFSSTVPSSLASTSVDTFTSQSTYGNCFDDNTVTLIHQSSIAIAFPYNVQFDSGTFTFNFVVQAQSRAAGQAGKVSLKLWKGYFDYNAGSGQEFVQTQIPHYVGNSVVSGFIDGTTTGSITTSATQTSTVTINPFNSSNIQPLIIEGNRTTGTNGYLVAEVYWHITSSVGGGGGNNSCDVMLMHGTSGSNFTSPNFRKRAFLAN